MLSRGAVRKCHENDKDKLFCTLKRSTQRGLEPGAHFNRCCFSMIKQNLYRKLHLGNSGKARLTSVLIS